MSKHVQTTSAAELDPVCGMTVNPSSAEGQVDHAGKTYYFCSSNCLKKFQQDPAKYLAKSRASAEPSLVTVGVSKPLTAGKLSPPGTTARQTDPVCGMDVDPATAKFHFEYSGKTYYFCCGGCLEKFRVDPEHYLNLKSSDNLVQLGVPRSTLAPLAQPASPSTSAAGERFYVCPMCPEVRQPAPGPCPSCGMALDPASPFPISKIEYTCPMHPEIIRSEPGSCPICGMALEPRTVTAHEEENPELAQHEPAFLGQRRADNASASHRDGRHASRHAHPALPARGLAPLDRIRACHSRRSLGRLAVLSARMGIAGPSLHEHVHADRHGHRRRLCLQPDRNRLPANLCASASAE